MAVEQFIITTNPTKNGAFGTWARSNGFDKETEDMVNSGYSNKIQTCLLSGMNYEEQTSRERVLKEGAKPNLFGRYREKDFEWKESVIRNKIEIVDESFSGRMNLSNIDFRANPEQAPFRLAKMILPDNRLLVVRISAIGAVYGDTRSGNYFEHGFVFPAGTNLTNEQIKNLPFQKGLTAEQQKNGIAPNLPTLNENQMSTSTPTQTKTQIKPAIPKTVCYGTISVPMDSPLGEIEGLICSIGVQRQLSDVPDFDTFAKQQLEENPDISEEEINTRYDSAVELARINDDKKDELKAELAEKIKNFPQKDTLKAFMNERRQYYRHEASNPSLPFADRQDCDYQDKGTGEAQRVFEHFAQKNKE